MAKARQGRVVLSGGSGRLGTGHGARSRVVLSAAKDPVVAVARLILTLTLTLPLILTLAAPPAAWAQAPAPAPPAPTPAPPPAARPGEGAPATPTATPMPWLLEAPATITAVLDGGEFPVFALTAPAGPLVAMEPIAERLGITVTSDPFEEGRIFEVGGVRVALQAGSAIATLDQELVTLSQPVAQQAGRFFVPLDLLERAFGDPLGLGVEFRGPERQLLLRRDALRDLELVVDRVHQRGTTTLALRVGDGAAVRYRLQRAADGALEIVFPGQRLRARLVGAGDDPFVRRMAPRADRLRLDLQPGTSVEHYELRDPFRIVLDFAAGAAVEPASPGASTFRLRRSAAGARRPGLSTIILDPGHGGEETGALGPQGSAEKNLTLDLARRLRDRLAERLPARIVLTRDGDLTLGLADRAALANEHGADLFVSLHLNSSRGGSPEGAETYFLSLQASDDRAASAAAVENENGSANPDQNPSAPGVLPADDDGGGGGGDNDLELLLWDLAQTRHLARSQRVAVLVQEELNASLGLRDRGVKQAPFRVLMGANMPAVLVELGFLSNPEEEKKLLDATYQERLVEALVRAIDRFDAELDPRPDGEPEPPTGPPASP